MHKLIISIVPHNSGEIITNAAKLAGSRGGTILMGRGTAENSIIQLLGLGDKSKDIVYILVEEEICQKVLDKIKESTESKKNFGIVFTIDINNFLRSGSIKNLKEEKQGVEKMNNSYEMINVIVNKGYAEDAMAAARKAGAGGGTIINARGTAKEGDAKFFGIEIVPEKEMLMILVSQDKKDEIIKAISDLPCLNKAGSGILFSNSANNFTVLGKK
ncbi:MAG: transcriptional regulator [Treponema sp.]|nr:transcriptional regulator [Treponema sp.]